jgi:NitT/TauT family transport system permease protein
MSAGDPATRPVRPISPPPPPWKYGYRWVLPLSVGLVFPIVALFSPSQLDPILNDLPFATYNLGASFLRMLLAYALSLAFSLGYGYLAAVNRTAERVMIPVLDILQSIPILGFLPVVIVVFVNLTGPQSLIGPNFASIFLIFTSMSWNMAFGVYESVKGLPHDLKEAGDSFGVRGGHRLRRLLLPAMVNRLVYNSVLSWTAGWYFLVAAEIISTNTSNIPLTGIGSYLLIAAANGDNSQIIAGVIALVALIAALDFFVWRNLGRWAERYRMDTSPSGETLEAPPPSAAAGPLRRVRGVVARGISSGATIVLVPVRALGSVTRLSPSARRATPAQRRRERSLGWLVLRYGSIGAVLVCCWLMLITLGVGVYGVLSRPISPSVRPLVLDIPLALGYSMSRVVAAYLVSLAFGLGLAIFLSRRPKVARVGLPFVQIIASVPATALFPLFLFSLSGVIGVEPAVVFVEVTGMVWYLFFNLLSGLRAIPPDLEESARSYGLKGRNYYRRLIFPGIFPAWVTGSITAFGGGWNTLIIAEFLTSGPHTIKVLGLGELIDIGVLPSSSGGLGTIGLPLMVLALITMVIAVVSVNQLIWKPLYRRATEKYRYD